MNIFATKFATLRPNREFKSRILISRRPACVWRVRTCYCVQSNRLRECSRARLTVEECVLILAQIFRDSVDLTPNKSRT